MKALYLTATAVVTLAGSPALATTVYNTSLQNQGGTVGTAGQNGVVTPSTRTTTTDATGTRTTVSANPGAANTGANRGSGTGVTNSWYQDSVGMGTTVGITTDYARSGNGSAYFNQVQANNGKADLQYYFGNSSGLLAPIALSSLTSFSYDYLRDGSSTTGSALVPILRLNIYKNGVAAGTLNYEPAYNVGNGPATTDSWLTGAGDLSTGKFWNNNGALGGSGQDIFQTLDAWIAGNAGSTLSVYGIQIGFGSGWNGTFTGAVDNVNVAFGNTVFASNFEVAQATAAVPEPATWVMMIAGFGLVGGAMRRRKTAVAFG